jgi:hypothetical protein
MVGLINSKLDTISILKKLGGERADVDIEVCNEFFYMNISYYLLK